MSEIIVIEWVKCTYLSMIDRLPKSQAAGDLVIRGFVVTLPWILCSIYFLWIFFNWRKAVWPLITFLVFVIIVQTFYEIGKKTE